MNADGETIGRQERSRWGNAHSTGEGWHDGHEHAVPLSAQPDPPSNAAVTTYVYDGYGNLLHVDEAPGTLARLSDLKAELIRKPKVEITRDPTRRVIKVTGRDGNAAEFEDRPTRFLVMDRNPATKA